jgi:hypothetical protein
MKPIVFAPPQAVPAAMDPPPSFTLPAELSSLDSDIRETLDKARELASGLRGALDSYDATARLPFVERHSDDCTCQLCSAIATLRLYVRNLELAIAKLERSLLERPA